MKLEELKIEALKPKQKGGQHVGVMQTGVRVTHIITGVTAECSAARSQLRNRNIALAMVEYALLELDAE